MEVESENYKRKDEKRKANNFIGIGFFEREKSGRGRFRETGLQAIKIIKKEIKNKKVAKNKKS